MLCLLFFNNSFFRLSVKIKLRQSRWPLKPFLFFSEFSCFLSDRFFIFVEKHFVHRVRHLRAAIDWIFNPAILTGIDRLPAFRYKSAESSNNWWPYKICSVLIIKKKKLERSGQRGVYRSLFLPSGNFSSCRSKIANQWKRGKRRGLIPAFFSFHSNISQIFC